MVDFGGTGGIDENDSQREIRYSTVFGGTGGTPPISLSPFLRTILNENSHIPPFSVERVERSRFRFSENQHEIILNRSRKGFSKVSLFGSATVSPLQD